jgi:hypothetical protein
MTKLCPRGKAAAKRKFKVYPSAYANAYASKICAGKIKDPSGVKRKDFKGPKPKTAKDGKLMTDENKKKQSNKKTVLKRFFPYKGPGTRVTRPDGTSTFKKAKEFSVGGHSVMGSPISVDVDGDNLTNASASAYYKDLLK